MLDVRLGLYLQCSTTQSRPLKLFCALELQISMLLMIICNSLSKSIAQNCKLEAGLALTSLVPWVRLLVMPQCLPSIHPWINSSIHPTLPGSYQGGILTRCLSPLMTLCIQWHRNSRYELIFVIYIWQSESSSLWVGLKYLNIDEQRKVTRSKHLWQVIIRMLQLI